ncbi:hypothetical protein [Microbulbifer rhizosphaerae]|uniref:Uncharacterized protein n=1 Tax=Microbulbifer rhizosphaerae TaxID=1562603 RepID=A0A7W4Z903_9GAMM|nr:hypothetical protein [Microbulbifer rhizosphaerae]MBB3059725.1 hypothetical protein [Microbulbifer rhizosphaerae]
MKIILRILALTVLYWPFLAFADLSENNLVPKEEMNFAKDYLGKLRNRDFDYVTGLMDPEIASDVSPEKLEHMLSFFPEGKLLSTELIGSRVHTINGVWTGNFTFEYQFKGGWALANAAMKRVDGKTTVIGLNVYRTPASQKELNRFSLSGKSTLHYLLLAMSIIVPVFILVTLVFCIKTPIQKRKWLWILFVLFGIGSISLNWTSGAYQIKILHLQLFGAGATYASEYSPLLLTVGIPLGAIIFWFKRRTLIAQSRAGDSDQQEAHPEPEERSV